MDNNSSEQDDTPWITIQRRPTRSLDSAKNSKYDKNVVHFKTKNLTMEQQKAVEAAAEALTKEQMAWVQHRQEIMHAHETDNEEQPESSKSKGKMIDPPEWGNAGINHEELMPETHQQFLMHMRMTTASKEFLKRKSQENLKIGNHLRNFPTANQKMMKIYRCQGPEVSMHRHRSVGPASHAWMTGVCSLWESN